MKRVVAFLIVLVLALSSILVGLTAVEAATKPVPVKEFSKVSTIAAYENVAIGASGISIISNADNKIDISNFDFTGTQKWQLALDSQADQIATASAIDGAGNLWLAGQSAPAPVAVTEVESSTAINPDGVIIESVEGIRSDLNQLTLWKVSSSGELLSTFIESITAPLIVTSISISSNGVSILGDRGTGGVIVSATLAGKFAKATTIGSGKTVFTRIFRNDDGSAQLFGSSNESLAGKSLAGLRDGILAKIGKTGKLTSVVRSSANKATRTWQDATSSNFLIGDVRTGNKSEVAITKFNSSFAPMWTIRLLAKGQTRAAIGPSGTHYGLINSTSSIAGVTGWKPTTATPIVLRFDSKGVITQALKHSEISTVDAMVHIAGVGLVVVTPTGIFKG
jgi:hypothetical protein